MEKNKIMRRIYFALALLFISSGMNTALSQEMDKGESIFIKVIEDRRNAWPSKVLISYGNGESESIELYADKFRHWDQNHLLVSKVIDRIEGMGYDLVSSNSVSRGVSMRTTTNYIFRRED